MTTNPLHNLADDAPDPLASDLRELTTDRGPETRLWENALRQHDSGAVSSKSASVLARLPRPNRRALLSIAAMLLLCFVMVSVLLPAVGRARYSSPALARHAEALQAQLDRDSVNLEAKYDAVASAVRNVGQTRGDVAGLTAVPISPPPMPQSDAVPTPTRSVIRKATLELDTTDVRAAFAKAQMVIRPDLGEFIEGSSLNGESKHAIAQITFRFAVSRMDIALNELRPLGTVKSETASGDDVTAQVVDLDARLRNERRVEQEVLALLESRKDAPLKEILDLRDKLAELRQNIEQLQGRKDSLSRQVSLSTVLLIIRPIDAPPEEPKSQLTPIGTYFREQFENSWRSGTQNLADALSWLIRTVIGGLPWWIALAVIALVIRRIIRRAEANSPQNTWARPPLSAGSPASPA